MRALRIILAAGALGLAMVAPAAVLPPTIGLQAEAPERRKRRKAALPTVAPRFRRSRGAPLKRKLRANRLHLSRRVRRKHRRAA